MEHNETRRLRKVSVNNNGRMTTNHSWEETQDRVTWYSSQNQALERRSIQRNGRIPPQVSALRKEHGNPWGKHHWPASRDRHRIL